jgi:DNA-binding LacI/PurR family transcriptional regulator
MPVSIKDIARLAGVSHSTVSRALRNSPLIPATTTQRIQQIAKEQGYRPSAVARSLVMRKTQAIGVVVTSIADPFNGDVVDGIEEIANEHGYSVILATSQANPDRELAVVRAFEERRVDGILVASSRVGALYLPVLAELRVPVVLINNQGRHAHVHTVAVHNTDGAYQATRHLVELGHTHIGYVGDRLGMQSDVERRTGYAKALEECGIAVASELTFEGDGKLDGGVEAARAFLVKQPRATAVFCYNDMTALGLLSELVRAGVRCPDDISVVGFDDIVFAALSQPALTTVRQPRRELGRRAMRMLLGVLRGELTEKEIMIRGELIVRASTAPLVS